VTILGRLPKQAAKFEELVAGSSNKLQIFNAACLANALSQNAQMSLAKYFLQFS
jgi:hypothetical protein